MGTTPAPGDRTTTTVEFSDTSDSGASANLLAETHTVLIANGVTAASEAPEKTEPLATATLNGEATPSVIRIDPALKSPDLFLNRELTWLQFNRRVLAEAEDARNPLLERLKFLAITASNLDEFFMKRIGGLKQQVAAGVHELTVDGRTPHQQIAQCYAEVRDFQRRQRIIAEALLAALAPHSIGVVGYEELSSEDPRAFMQAVFRDGLLPAMRTSPAVFRAFLRWFNLLVTPEALRKTSGTISPKASVTSAKYVPVIP